MVVSDFRFVDDYCIFHIEVQQYELDRCVDEVRKVASDKYNSLDDKYVVTSYVEQFIIHAINCEKISFRFKVKELSDKEAKDNAESKRIEYFVKNLE